MALETFEWTPDGEVQGDITFRVRSARFGDGYAQVVGDGPNNEQQSWPLTFGGTADEIAPIRDFLRAHGGYRSFRWTPPLGEPGLYRCARFGIAAAPGGTFRLTATFEQAFAS